ncbi:response regulator [Mucilaginibacter mali]|uniref:Response regulator n=1 Tax=Mucilaginibacter mali TaxID=2740462 RepID=A0A7D4TSI6_9SPHI|nr:response regulator [Mucilaginibacter mali]QKJ28335.1 response regulator [Mucilaginibacter mali]
MDKLLKAVIIDDEPPARRMLKELLAAHPTIIQITGEASNGHEAISIINTQRPDVLFLDIQLPDMLGFDILSQLNYQPFVIFTTAYDEYAVKAFETLSVDYLLKPIKDSRLQQAVNKLQQFTGGKSTPSVWSEFEDLLEKVKPRTEIKTLSVKKGNKFTLVQLADVLYFEAYDKYTFVHMQNGEKLFCDHMLAILSERLSADFIRVQKSYIVNKQKIVEIHKYSNNRFTLVLNNRDFTRIVTGPSYHELVREAFGV